MSALSRNTRRLAALKRDDFLGVKTFREVQMSSSTEHKPEWVPVDFESATIQTNPSKSKVLIVKGQTPSSSSEGSPVKLQPVKYVVRPEYWRIDVLWDRADAIFQSLNSYEAPPLDLTGVTGTKGIEVVGKDRSEKIDV